VEVGDKENRTTPHVCNDYKDGGRVSILKTNQYIWVERVNIEKEKFL
jgi:hypothetical protein